MGQFSWKCADTGHALLCHDIEEERIGQFSGTTERLVEDSWTKTAYLLIPKEFGGGYYSVDNDYDGYGEFYDKDGNAHDAYEELARWNGVEDPGKDKFKSRCNAIELYYTAADPSRSQYEDYNHNVPATMKYPIKITESPMPYEAAGCATDDPNQGWGEYESADDEW